MDKVEFVFCSENEDIDTTGSEKDYSDTDCDFESHWFVIVLIILLF